MRAGLCFGFLATGTGVLALLAFAQSSMEGPVEVPVPTRLGIERTAERLALSYDLSSVQNVKIEVSKNRFVGIKTEWRVYATGDARPVEAGFEADSSFNGSAGYLKATHFINRAQGGVPAPGKDYVIEEDISVFETDVPPQHMWPYTSKNFRILWSTTLKART